MVLKNVILHALGRQICLLSLESYGSCFCHKNVAAFSAKINVIYVPYIAFKLFSRLGSPLMGGDAELKACHFVLSPLQWFCSSCPSVICLSVCLLQNHISAKPWRDFEIIGKNYLFQVT